jgi:ribosomal protein L11 methylase PrmA
MRPAYTFAVFRLDLQHHAIQCATGKRFFAPIVGPRCAIDIGTGTGIWMLASIYTTYVIPTTY